MESLGNRHTYGFGWTDGLHAMFQPKSQGRVCLGYICRVVNLSSPIKTNMIKLMEEIARKQWFNLMAPMEFLLNNMGYLHSNCGCFSSSVLFTKKEN